MTADSAGSPPNRTVLPLGVGRHTITIWALDPDLLLDQILITSDRAFVPAPPVLSVPAGAKDDEGVTLLLTNTATASNPSATQLSYSLTSAPTGMTIDPLTGVISWTPSEEQGPGTNVIGVQVTDNGSPPMSEVSAFQVVVNEVNRPPFIESVPRQSIRASSLFTFKIPASDPDIPTNGLTFSLDQNAPAGAFLDRSSGVLTWRPTLAQANNTYTVTVLVTDDGSPSLSSSGSFSITVTPPPILIELTSAVFENQEFHVRVRAVPGVVYLLEASTDFVSWTSLTSESVTNAEFELVDSNAANYPHRFYRVVAQQQ